MASELDLFFDAADRSSFTHTRTSGVVSGATELKVEGTAFTLQAAPATPFAVGQKVFVYDGLFGAAYCIVKKVTSSTNITLLPLKAALDTVALPYTFPDGSTILMLDEAAAVCVVDLSDAPGNLYEYLIVGCGTLETSGSPADIQAFLRTGALIDDPYSGSAGHGDCRVTSHASNGDRFNFVAATKAQHLGGQRYEHSLNFNAITANTVATIRNPRLLALRYTGGYFAGDGKTSEQTTTTFPAYTDYLTLPANLPAGDYLIVSTWALGSPSGAGSECLLEVDGSTVLANQVSVPKGASNYIPGGFFGLVTLGATNQVRLRYRSIFGFQCRIKNAFLAAIPIANIPALDAVHKSQDLATEVTQVVTDNNFIAVATSDSVDLEPGRHIEIISASVGGDNPFRSRANFGAAGTGLGGHNIELGTAVGFYVSTFWFIRNDRTAGPTTNAVEMRRNTGVSTTLRARDFSFSWLRERPDFRALPNERMAVVADLELGGRIYKNWNTTTTTGRFAHRLPDVDLISRVSVNGVDYLEVFSVSDLAEGKWFWDHDAKDVYVQLPTGDTPADADVTVVVVPLLLVGRTKEVLQDSRGRSLPYLPLLKAVPGSTQRLEGKDARFKSVTTLGRMTLVASHGRFDDQILKPSFEGFRAKVRRGFPRETTRLDDFEVVSDAIISEPSFDPSLLTMQLVNRRLLMQRPICTTKITVREGVGADATTRADHLLPKLVGAHNRVRFYRITADETSGGWNEYRACDHVLKSVSAVYLDGRTRKKVASGNIDVTSTYTADGRIRVKNVDAAGNPTTEPPDVVYADVVGITENGLTTGVAPQTLGAILRFLFTTWGEIPATGLVEKTLRMIDRRWRYQLDNGIKPLPPKLGLIIDGTMNVEQAATKLCGDGFAYWLENRVGRIAVDVPDLAVGNQTKDPGFEDELIYWRAMESATLARTSTRKYEGSYSAEITNGSPVGTTAHVAQSLVLRAGGTHVATLVASLLSGESSAFRIGMIGPSGVEVLSEAFVLETGTWGRYSLVYDAAPGDSGHAELRIYPAYGSSTPTTIAVDNVEVYPVAVVADRVKSTPGALTLGEEHFYECDVTYGVNPEDPKQVSRRTVNESEARQLSSALPSEGKFSVQSSKRAEILARAVDAPSAAGIGAPVVLHHSRSRPQQVFHFEGLERLPLVGEYFFHRDNPRVPEMANGYPIWRIIEVAYRDTNAKSATIKAERQLDPVVDRIDIAPDSVPMGASAWSLSPDAITDFADIAALLGQFLKGATTPDLVTQRGSLVHEHPLDHDHDVPEHDHEATLVSHGLDTEGAPGKAWPVEHIGDYKYPGPVGPQEGVSVSRGKTAGGHLHPVTGSADVAPATGKSSLPNATLKTLLGPVEPPYIRVRVLQRTGNTTTTINPKLVIGLLSSVIPAGWKRVTMLDRFFLRVASSNGPVATRVTTAAFSTAEAGSTLNVQSATGITVGKRLTVTNTADANKVVHVVVSAIVGTALTVLPLHETGDQANGYSFPNAATSTVSGDSEQVVWTNVATSAFTPNDGGSTLKLASATNVAVGSLLKVVNLADGDKYVHVRVTALAGTDATVVPLHFSGDQPNSYSFPASANSVVMHSEFPGATHKHGGAIDPHVHAGGGHPHGAAQFIAGPADSGQQAQKFLGGASENIALAALDGHGHEIEITAPPDNTNSGSAGGTITGDVSPLPGYVELVFITPLDANQRIIPARGVLMWTQSGSAPQGFRKITAAKDLLIKGAEPGQMPGSSEGGHEHEAQFDEHSYVHAHGETVIQPSKGPGEYELIDEKPGAEVISVAAGEEELSEGGHAHLITASLANGQLFPSNGAVTMLARTQPTGTPSASRPLHKNVVLIEKL